MTTKHAPSVSPAGNRPYAVAMLALRWSNATTPIPSGRRYRRRPKHTKSSEED